MIQDRKAAPPKKGEETLIDLFISFTDNEELQLADAMEFASGAQVSIEYRKPFNHITSLLFSG